MCTLGIVIESYEIPLFAQHTNTDDQGHSESCDNTWMSVEVYTQYMSRVHDFILLSVI